MKNSESELINRYSERLGALVDAPPSFRNLDVVSVMDNPARPIRPNLGSR